MKKILGLLLLVITPWVMATETTPSTEVKTSTTPNADVKTSPVNNAKTVAPTQTEIKATTETPANTEVKTAVKKTTLALPKEAKTIEAFVAKGWKIEQKIVGELSNDKLPDTVLELREDKKSDDNMDIARQLLVLTATKDKAFRLIGHAEKLLRCPGCFGALADAEGGNADIKIAKGILIVDQLWGSRETQNTIQRFRYDAKKQRLVLIGEDVKNADRATGDASSKSMNYLSSEQVDEVFKNDKTANSKKTKIPLTVKYLEDVNNLD